MSSAAPKLISVDWGTTSLRCMLVADDGTVLEHARSERGILKADGVPFGDILFGQIEPWLGLFPRGNTVPVMMSGMIGSQQGWKEATYLRCPASPKDLAGSLTTISTSGTPLAGCDLRIVPGMDLAGDQDEDSLPDVMRGEETQVLGALIDAELTEAVYVLPGTHSKWVFVDDGSIVEFRTFMTGEIFAAVLDATILGRLVEGDGFDEDGFALGVNTVMNSSGITGPGDLLHMLFSGRSRVLHGELAGSAVRGYLSGMLIAAEILAGADAAWYALSHDEPNLAVLRIIGEPGLQAYYARAASLMGFNTEPGLENPVPIAHLAIARMAGIVS